MSEVKDLLARIDSAFASVKEKLKSQQQSELRHFQEQQKKLAEYEKVRTRIVEIAKPRLEALARRAGERAAVTPSVSESRRSVRFEFRSPKAYITLSFSVAPDQDIQNAVVESDLQIVPVLWKFDSHSEFSSPIASFDTAAMTQWLDDRIVSFVELYIHIHEGELFDKAEYVEDPISKVKFPKFAAGATLDHGGQTHFFVDEASKKEFARQKGIGGA